MEKPVSKTESPWAGGRIDGHDDADLRWHQILKDEAPSTIIGFCSDEGVRRNKGRTGAAYGPDAIRRQLRNLPAFSLKALADHGNIFCENDDLESAQNALADAIAEVLNSGSLPLILGGGHEVAWGSFQGIQQYIDNPESRVGIINIDAHFDLREPEDGVSPTSGTSFWHMHQHCQANNSPFDYLVLGIQKMGNTPRLFQTASNTGTNYVLAEKIEEPTSRKTWQNFIEKVDHVYLTICLDAFSESLAPGVSAPGILGMEAGNWVDELFDSVKASGKLICMDIAEMNPAYDVDNRTARFAASLLFRMLIGPQS